jgi:hypothetical protein
MKLSLAEAIEATQSIVNVTRIFGMDRGIRRIPFITFKVLHACGVIVHQTYNQRFPQSEKALAAKARDKYLMGYHDVRLENEPDVRLLKFIGENLPKVLPPARLRFVLEAYGGSQMGYGALAKELQHKGWLSNE